MEWFFDWMLRFAEKIEPLANLAHLAWIVGSAVSGILICFGGYFGVRRWHSWRQERDQAQNERDRARKERDTAQAALDAAQKNLSRLTAEREALAQDNAALKGKLARVRDAFEGDENDLWQRTPIERPENYDAAMRNSIPILLVANLKGGVAKTTISANLAAYFETAHRERILAIDLDYQGSLSSMLLPEEVERQARTGETIRRITAGTATGHFVIAGSAPLRARQWKPESGRQPQQDSRIIDCTDTYANYETRLVVEWLLGDIRGDIRYNLAKVLLTPEIQNNFDRVIIDSGPRITTGFINALCASTHLVVPFVLDFLSAERAGLFLRRLKGLKGALFPHLDLAALVGTMKFTGAGALKDTELLAITEAKAGAAKNWGMGDYVLENLLIPRKQAIMDAAGQQIAYYLSKEVRDIFDPLGRELYRRTLTQRSQAHASRRAQGHAVQP